MGKEKVNMRKTLPSVVVGRVLPEFRGQGSPLLSGRGNSLDLRVHNTENTNIKEICTACLHQKTIKCKIIYSHPCYTCTFTHTLHKTDIGNLQVKRQYGRR